MQLFTTPSGNLYLFTIVQLLYAFTLHSISSPIPGGNFVSTFWGIEGGANAQETFGGNWLSFAITFWLTVPLACVTAAAQKRGPSAAPLLVKLHSVVLTMIFVIQACIISSGCKSAGGVVADIEMIKAIAVNYVMLLVFGSVQRSCAGSATPNSTSPYPPFSGSARKPKTALFALAIVFNFYIVLLSVTSPVKSFNTAYFNPATPRTSIWQMLVCTMVCANLLQWFVLTYGSSSEARSLLAALGLSMVLSEVYEATEGGGAFITEKTKAEDTYVNLGLAALCLWGYFDRDGGESEKKN